MRSDTPMHGTTILAVRHGGSCALAGDGQVTLGQTVVKHRAKKIQRLHNGDVLAGFAGSTADAMALIHRFEARLEEYRGNLQRAAVELAKEWRSDRVLRRLVADGASYRARLRERHAALQVAYPDEERLREQAARHDRVFAENLALLAEALAE